MQEFLSESDEVGIWFIVLKFTVLKLFLTLSF